jgi:AcrR family transcriptional regulator
MSVSPEPRTAPARSRSETRRRLVDAATRLFAKDGLHGVTTHAIARAAGVAAGTFYLHFEDKEALFREVAFEAARALRSRMERAGASSPDPGVGVRARAAELLAFAEENRSLVQILFGRNHEASGVGVDVLEFLAEEIERSLRTRGSAGLLAQDVDIAVAAQALVGMRARIVAWWAEQPGRIPRERVIESLARIQASGIYRAGATRAAPDPASASIPHALENPSGQEPLR